MTRDLTKGSITGNLLRFSIPYLISCFLQTFYGLADLFFIGKFNDAASTTGVSGGSQLMHMVTLVIAGIAMGSTVQIANSVGAGNEEGRKKYIGNTVTLFIGVVVLLTVVLVAVRYPVLRAIQMPEESMSEAERYVFICFLGIPFITAYNVISSIFRGLGDTRHPLYFVAIAGVVNVILDYVLIGIAGMGAAGAAVATVAAQAVSVVISLIYMIRKRVAGNVKAGDLRPEKKVLGGILSVGLPIAAQDAFVQIAFLVITAVANGRGVEMAAAVGIVEKIITFLFLVPSAMLSSVSAVASQNKGAGKHDRSLKTLRSAMIMCVSYGAATVVICELIPAQIVSIFTNDTAVIPYGVQYLRTYCLDTMVAGVHFCFTGFFSAYNKSIYAFIMNIISILAVRIPGAWLASKLFPETLLPMGIAAPAGSLLSGIICVLFFLHMRKTVEELKPRGLR